MQAYFQRGAGHDGLKGRGMVCRRADSLRFQLLEQRQGDKLALLKRDISLATGGNMSLDLLPDSIRTITSSKVFI